MDLLDAKKVIKAVEDGHTALSWARLAGADHIRAYTGKYYGNSKSKKARLINLTAQLVQAWMPTLALNRPKAVFAPRRGGPNLTMQAKMLSSLVNQALEEMDAARTLYRPAVTAALFYPLSPTYTGLRTGSHFLEVNGHQYDPGMPFTIPIDFDDWSCDPFAKSLAGRNFEAHKFTMSKASLLESPAFADKVDLIQRLTSIEDGGRARDEASQSEGQNGVWSQSLAERVQLWNVVIYQGDKIIEGTIPTAECGPAEWLRLAEFEGPQGGPYDHIWWHNVPGNAMPLPPASVTRDIADAADTTAAKMVRGIAKSKKVLGYTPSGKDMAKSLDEAEEFSSLKMDDPTGAKVFDMDMMSPELMDLLGWMQGTWNNAAGNPTLIGGMGRISGTATEADILNARSSTRLLDMQEQVLSAARSHVRKHAWYFQTDPIMEYMVPIPLPKGDGSDEMVDIPYTPADRTGRPEDFKFEVDINSMAGIDPNMKAKRLVEALGIVGQMMPLAQAGIVQLPGLVRVLGRNMQVEGLDEVIGDPTMIQQNMQADMEAETMNQRASQASDSTQGPAQQSVRQQGQDRAMAGPVG